MTFSCNKNGRKNHFANITKTSLWQLQAYKLLWCATMKTYRASTPPALMYIYLTEYNFQYITCRHTFFCLRELTKYYLQLYHVQYEYWTHTFSTPLRQQRTCSLTYLFVRSRHTSFCVRELNTALSVLRTDFFILSNIPTIYPKEGNKYIVWMWQGSEHNQGKERNNPENTVYN